jgi:hypothetical protein
MAAKRSLSTICHLERRPKELASKGKSKDPENISIATQRSGNSRLAAGSMGGCSFESIAL